MLKKMTLAVRDRVGKAYSAGSRVMALVFGRSFVERYPWVFGALLAGIILYLFADLLAIFSGRAWYADGGFWFFRLLKDQRVLVNTASREFGEVMSQIPVYLAIKFGIRNRPILAALFSAPFFSQFFFSLLLCAWAAGGKNFRYLLFPLISLFAGSMNGTMMIVYGGHLLVSLYWPLLFFVLFCQRFSFWKAVVFAVMAFISLQTYESMVCFGMILGALAVWRSWRERKNPVRCGIWALIALWFFGGALLAAQEIHRPTFPECFAGFKDGFFSIVNPSCLGRHPMLLLSLVALLFFSLLPFLSGRAGRSIFAVFIMMFCPFALFVGFTSLFFPGWVDLVTHSRMRGFYSLLPVPLTFALLGSRAFPRLKKSRSGNAVS